MAHYQIEEGASAVVIEVTGIAGHQEQLMEAFDECQAGKCSCPTSEYDKLATIGVEQDANRIRLRLEPRPGEKFDIDEIAACLDDTTARVTGPSRSRGV